MKLKLNNPLGHPLHINQHFGENLNSFYKQLGLVGHNGTDIQAMDGETIFACHDGIVTFAGEDGSGGLGVVIRTKEQFDYKDGQSYFKSIYWHIQKGSFMVHASDEVKLGQPIAKADNTGMSTRTHLHLGVKPVYQGEQDWQWYNLEQNNGYNGAIDPELYLDQSAVKYVFLNDMRFGDENDDVRRMQLWLQNAGYFPIAQKATGFYGKITIKAVRDFLHSKGIEVSGLTAGPMTRSYLNS